jgi:hypothetical protein
MNEINLFYENMHWARKTTAVWRMDLEFRFRNDAITKALFLVERRIYFLFGLLKIR